jgi:hypothetical protein
MFAKELKRGRHTRRFVVRDAGPAGWEVREERDDEVLKEVRYTDWHRVERAVAVFSLAVSRLERQGWVEA